MSNKPFTIRKAYVLSAIDKAGARVYYDIDSGSGYPYWGSYFGRKEFTTLNKIPTIGPEDYMRTDVISIEVLEITYQAKVVQITEIVSEAKAKAMAEIDAIQKELACKIARLEGTK